MSTQVSQSPSRMSRDEQAKRIAETLKKQQDLHFSKTQNSYSAFKNTKVTSCSSVLMKNGHTVALSFPSPHPKPVDLRNMMSSETTSLAQ